jgi:hypothetical protein
MQPEFKIKGEIAVVELRQPYWSAGQKYQWEYSDQVGFGINADILRRSENIIIKTKWGDYFLTVKDCFDVYRKYKCEYMAHGIKLIVIPRAICQKCEGNL